MSDPEQEVQQSEVAANESAATESPAPESPDPPAPRSAGAPELALVKDVRLRLSVEVGATEMSVGDILRLESGAVVELDRDAGDPADVLVNGKRIGRAEVTVEDDRLAIRLVELLDDSSSG